VIRLEDAAAPRQDAAAGIPKKSKDHDVPLTKKCAGWIFASASRSHIRGRLERFTTMWFQFIEMGLNPG
jgi:hypothetical protein